MQQRQMQRRGRQTANLIQQHARQAAFGAARVVRIGKGDRDVSTKVAEHAKRYAAFASELRRHVEDNCDYVGTEFTEEARKIHYGESEARGIYGEASDDDAAALDEEGIERLRAERESRSVSDDD